MFRGGEPSGRFAVAADAEIEVRASRKFGGVPSNWRDTRRNKKKRVDCQIYGESNNRYSSRRVVKTDLFLATSKRSVQSREPVAYWVVGGDGAKK